MDPTARAYEEILERFIEWARGEESIRAAVVIGSRARTDHPADEWADLDVIVLARDADRYISESGWVENLGVPWITFIEPTADGRAKERRVLFEGGLDVDFAILPVELVLPMLDSGAPPDVADMFSRGMRILLDKDGLGSRLPATGPARRPPELPTESEFHETTSDFWYHAVWTAKHLRRGELWWAKSGCDAHMKGLMRAMLEWHARATQGLDSDTWFRGRFLEEWADPRALEGLRTAFAYYDAEDVRRALFETMDLFRWLADETATRLGFVYAASEDRHASELVRTILPEKTHT